MEYRSLGRTGVQVSALCFGCAGLGNATPAAEALDLVDQALGAGINYLDTANIYGPSEELVGRALARNGQRDAVVLATKGGSVMQNREVNGRGPSRRHLIEQCEASLRRLGTDWIDLYQIHLPAPEVPLDETLRALDDLIRAGKVRYIGGSNYAAWQYVEALWVSRELGLNRFISEQPHYSLLDRTIEPELVPCAQTYGLALLPYSPLAMGILTGKYRSATEAPAGARFSADSASLQRALTPAVLQALGVLETMAAEKNCTMGQLALAWCLRQPGVTAPIIGPRTAEQLVDNLGALEVTITAEDRARLDAVAPPGEALVWYRRHYTPFWGPHPQRW